MILDPSVHGAPVALSIASEEAEVENHDLRLVYDSTHSPDSM